MALCAIHNFIISHQPDEEALPDDDPDGLPGLQEDTNGTDDPEDEDEGDTSLRNRIASAMWDDYVQHTEALAAETDSDIHVIATVHKYMLLQWFSRIHQEPEVSKYEVS